ncbi:MAG: NADP oxidoreductase [Proteobacteria bacterium]|nr:NADP oxidoreductase [Pseudomonadota bacterium]
MAKIGLATTWLDGCSGCHMSLLDLDEGLIALADKVEILYGPLVDYKTFPDHADVTLVEGAVSSEADKKNILHIRARSGVLVSFGDCAVTANVPGMRNRYPVEAILRRGYVENADLPLLKEDEAETQTCETTFQEVPRLCRIARPVHEFVHVDVFLPGCPPPPEAIFYLLSELLAGRIPDMRGRTRFGA